MPRRRDVLHCRSAVRHPARTARRVGAGVVVAAMALGSVAVAAQSATRVAGVAPTAMNTSVGSTGQSQTVSALKVADQTGTADTWGRYVEFIPKAGQHYLGERTYTVPIGVRQQARRVSLQVNYRGPRKADQAWTWSAYDWRSKTWIRLGDNTGSADWSSWATMTTSGVDAARVIGGDGSVRVRLQSSNDRDVLNVDAESLQVTTNRPPTKPPQPIPGRPAPSKPAPPAVPPTVPPAPQPGKPVALPPIAGQFDYQLSEAYPPPKGVTILERDHTAQPVPGLYNICYINGLQTQPEDIAWWVKNHPDLLLTTSAGKHVYDSEWGEVLFDVSTDAKRRKLMEVQKAWVDGCAAKGFQAVEADAQDSYNRSQGLLTFEHDKEFMKLFAAYAHSKGLAVVQKNAGVEYGATGKTEVGFDFALAEECEYWNECHYYTDVYGPYLIEVEYTDQPLSAFIKACASRKGQHTILRRDRQLVAPGQPGYSYTLCS